MTEENETYPFSNEWTIKSRNGYLLTNPIGSVLKCHCGKDAVGSIIGVGAVINFCQEHRYVGYND